MDKNNDSNIKIFIISHIKSSLLQRLDLDKCYEYIHVGENNLGGYKLNDNVGDNISYKNNCYCELTGTYWVWKNTKDKIKGIVHYRRFFFHPFKSIFKYKFYNENDFIKIFSKYDVILPVKSNIRKTSKEANCRLHYAKNQIKSDFDVLENVIKNNFPDYYQLFLKMANGHLLTLYNMIIANEKVFNEYCSFVFSVLKLCEKEIDISKRNTQDQRVFGYLSERLTDVFFYAHPEYKIKRVPVCFFGESRFLNIIRHLFKFY